MGTVYFKKHFQTSLNIEKSSFSVTFSGAFLCSGTEVPEVVLFSALLVRGFPESLKEEGVWSQILKTP